jgi:hypothetical protein
LSARLRSAHPGRFVVLPIFAQVALAAMWAAASPANRAAAQGAAPATTPRAGDEPLTCPPRTGPPVMRVFHPRMGRGEILDAREEAQPGAGDREAA